MSQPDPGASGLPNSRFLIEVELASRWVRSSAMRVSLPSATSPCRSAMRLFVVESPKGSPSWRSRGTSTGRLPSDGMP